MSSFDVSVKKWRLFVCFFFFKQKTAYEMLRSLVGSEMCIRDSLRIMVSAANYSMPPIGGVALGGGWDQYLHHEHGKASYFGVRVRDQGTKLCAPPVCVLDFDFSQSCLPKYEAAHARLQVESGGDVNAAVWFFEVDLDDDEMLSNAPDGQDTHWMQAAQMLQGPVAVEPGDTLTPVSYTHLTLPTKRIV
eukprot:TRINITY_DN31287_c0_g1_i1.p1 TRINITY_DN31287_c0_g1~~TRINITY_DN31287_c0_g1_i1.p1  ORF type:complete len:190 (+),score=56.03 TRINITY_DN31287_c0_g1_i1:45-614(+)